MTMRPFAHATASSVAEAVEVLSEGCRPLAGGTDLLGLMKAGLAGPEQLVSLRGIAELSGMEAGDDGSWRLGAMVTLSELAKHRGLFSSPALTGLQQALVGSASPQLRHMVSIGGNLVQQPRCWYYRNPLTHCWRKGGRMCYAFRGENPYHVILAGGPCYAVHPSDPAVALVALDSSVELAGPEGPRTLALTEFYRLPNREDRDDTVLGQRALITQVIVPAQPEGTRGAYAKVAERAAWDFALVSAGAQVTMVEGRVQRARIALGGVANIPWRATEAEESLVGRPLDAGAIDAAAGAATSGAKPLRDNAHKVDLVQAAVSQALQTLATQS